MLNHPLFILVLLTFALPFAVLFVAYLTAFDVVEDDDAPHLEMYKSLWKRAKFATFCLSLSFLFLLCEGLITYICYSSGAWTISPFLLCGGISSGLSIIGFCLLWKKKLEILANMMQNIEKRYS